MLPEKQLKSYTDFYDSARSNDILEPKTTPYLSIAFNKPQEALRC